MAKKKAAGRGKRRNDGRMVKIPAIKVPGPCGKTITLEMAMRISPAQVGYIKKYCPTCSAYYCVLKGTLNCPKKHAFPPETGSETSCIPTVQ